MDSTVRAPAPEEPTTTPEHPDIAWLQRSLWPAPVRSAPVTSAPGAGRGYLANPSPSNCSLLIPTASARAASESVRRYHNGASARDRVIMAATELGLRVGASRLLRSRRVTVPWPSMPTFVEAVAPHVDAEIAHVAFTLGPRRSNRKPVAQLFDRSGRTLAFAKIGVDAFTNDLVATEAGWLRTVHESRSDTLRAPRPLWSGSAEGCNISVIEAVWAKRTPPRAPRALASSLLLDIHRLGPTTTGSLRDTAAYEALRHDEDPTAASRVRRALAAIADHPDARHELSLGAWHGDLTPWNILTTSSGPVIIDWETAEGAMPVGLDALNALVGAAMQLDSRTPTDAIAVAAGGLTDVCTPLGIDGPAARSTLLVLALEYIRRDLALERAGRKTSGLGDAALALLEGEGS